MWDKIWAEAKETAAEASGFSLGSLVALSPRLSSPRTWGSVCSLILWSHYWWAGSDRPALKHSPLGRANPGPHPVPSRHTGCYTPGETQRAASPVQFHLVSIPGERKASDRECGPIRLLPRRENTQTRRLISTHVHTHTPLGENSGARPSPLLWFLTGPNISPPWVMG